MTIPAPTSNWNDRPLKGRDFGTARPAEPASFEPAAEPVVETGASPVAARDEDLFARREEMLRRHEAPSAPAGDIFETPLTSKSDLDTNRRDALLDAPLTSKLDGSARSDMFDAPLTTKADLDGSALSDDRPLTRREPRVERSAAPLTTAAYAAPSDVMTPRYEERADEAHTPAYGQARPKSRSRMLLMAAPVGLAAVAAVGFIALNSGGEATAPTPTTPAAEPLAAAPVAAEPALTGMGVSDLGASAPAVETAAATPPAPRVQARAATRPAARPETRPETRSAPAETQAAATPTPPAAPVEQPIVAQPTPVEPTVTAPTTAPEPLITTEPLPLG